MKISILILSLFFCTIVSSQEKLDPSDFVTETYVIDKDGNEILIKSTDIKKENNLKGIGTWTAAALALLPMVSGNVWNFIKPGDSKPKDFAGHGILLKHSEISDYNSLDDAWSSPRYVIKIKNNYTNKLRAKFNYQITVTNGTKLNVSPERLEELKIKLGTEWKDVYENGIYIAALDCDVGIDKTRLLQNLNVNIAIKNTIWTGDDGNIARTQVQVNWSVAIGKNDQWEKSGWNKHEIRADRKKTSIIASSEY